MRRTSSPKLSLAKNGKAAARAAGDLRLYRIQVIDRAVEILNCFSFDHPNLSVTEIAARTGLHKSTAHRILMALEYNGLIRQTPETGHYHLGVKLFGLGNQAVARLSLRDAAKPYLIRLMEETKETVHLAVLDEGQVLYLEKVERAPCFAHALTGWAQDSYSLHFAGKGDAFLPGRTASQKAT